MQEHEQGQKQWTLEEYRNRLTLSVDQLTRVSEDFQHQMRVGLQDEKSNLLMIPTMVDIIPDGHEKGELFGIEIGGTKLHLIYTRLPEALHQVDTVQIEDILVPEAYRHCHSEQLFDYIVERMLHFCQAIGRDMRKAKKEVVIGFCFSFPCQHESIKSGKLIKWTKGFENEGGIGHDPAKMLTAAFRRKDLRVAVESLANDTVGVLCATRYTAGPDANISVIMGTGTNACYVERLSNIEKFRFKYFSRTPEMVINVEWPGFVSEAIPYLEEDLQLDRESHRPGEQRFEKLTSGLYMGDIARRILYSLSQREGWFGDKADQLSSPASFNTVQLAAIAQDKTQDLGITAEVLSDVLDCAPETISEAARKQAKDVCFLVTRRSAQLIAATIIAILRHIERSGKGAGEKIPNNIVAIEGGIFAEYRLYREVLCSAVKKIAGEEFAAKFQLKRTEGGASFGAAAMAAASYAYDKRMGHLPDSQAPLRKFPKRRTSSSGSLASQELSPTAAPPHHSTLVSKLANESGEV